MLLPEARSLKPEALIKPEVCKRFIVPDSKEMSSVRCRQKKNRSPHQNVQLLGLASSIFPSGIRIFWFPNELEPENVNSQYSRSPKLRP